MTKGMDIESLLNWRRERAEAHARQAPSAASLLLLAEPWWNVWPDRFAASVRRLASIQLSSYGYAMSYPTQGHTSHPVSALIGEGDEARESSARVLYFSVREGRLRLRFQVAPVPRTDRLFEVTFVSETALRPVLLAHADLSGDGEYSLDVALSEDLAAAWESLKVTDPMPFRFILRPAV